MWQNWGFWYHGTYSRYSAPRRHTKLLEYAIDSIYIVRDSHTIRVYHDIVVEHCFWRTRWNNYTINATAI